MKKPSFKPEIIWLLVALVLAGGFWVSKNLGRPAGSVLDLKAGDAPSPASLDLAEAGEIVVQVAGAVKKPGVYRLAAGSRQIDALAAAGGTLTCADLDPLNLAQPVQDGQKITVKDRTLDAWTSPAAGTRPKMAGSTGASTGQGAGSGQVNVNSATLEQLQTLPGIGPKLAQNIFQYREAHGPFGQWDDLRNVQGIGEKRLAKIKEAAAL